MRADHFAAIEDLGLIADDHTEDLRTPRMEMPPTHASALVANGQVEDHFDGGFLVGAAEAELCPGVTA